jgi:hypothetical protein
MSENNSEINSMEELDKAIAAEEAAKAAAVQESSVQASAELAAEAPAKEDIAQEAPAPQPEVQTPKVAEPPVAKQTQKVAPKIATAAPKIAPAKAAAQAADVRKTQTEVKPTDFESYLESIRTGESKVARALLSAMEDYSSKMAPRLPVTGDAGARIQHSFWKNIVTAIRSSEHGEFPKIWNLLLRYIHNAGEKSAFGDRYVYRFAEYWQYNQTELDAYQRILNLVKTTANSETRQAKLKEVDLVRSLSLYFTEEDRQRIIQFYTA